MFEKIPLSDLKHEFRNYIGCWKTLVFGGLAINEGESISPVAIQIWASDDDHEQTSVFQFPDVPKLVVLFKLSRFLPSAWPMFDDILDQKTVHIEKEIYLSLSDFKFVDAAFLTTAKYEPQYPMELHNYVGDWPRLFFTGMFGERLYNNYASKINKEFDSGKFLYPTLEDATSHLIGINVSTMHNWGKLYGVLKIPIKLEANIEDLKLRYKLELPEDLERLSKEVRCLVKSKAGERYEIISMPPSKHIKDRILFKSVLTLQQNEQAKEVILYLGDKRVASVSILQPLGEEVVSRSASVKAKISSEVANKRKVFVVHGRNESVRETIFSFLRAIDLEPIEWVEAIGLARKRTGDMNPYIGDILDTAFTNAQAIVVLMTGDDLARLGTRFTEEGKSDEELTPQARPNVIFESGLALGRHPERTILVELGTLRHISDLAGRHVVKMDGSIEARQELVNRLRDAGCDVRTEGKTEWLKLGDFKSLVIYPDKEVSGGSVNKKTDAKLAALREFKSDFEVFLRRIEAEWKAERDSEPYGIDEAKIILETACSEALSFRAQIVEDEGIISGILDEAAKRLKSIQRHRLTMDGGRSMLDFFEKGTQIIELLKTVPREIDSILG
ncbi:hypothetical protein ES703_78797 [subsurface metagenome]